MTWLVVLGMPYLSWPLAATHEAKLSELADYTFHKLRYDVEIDAVRVPRLRAAFYRREDGERVHSVGLYMFDGVELFRAGGFVGNEHCSWHAVSRWDDEPDGPYPGCPDVAVRRSGTAVDGLVIRTPRQQYHVSVPSRVNQASPEAPVRPRGSSSRGAHTTML